MSEPTEQRDTTTIAGKFAEPLGVHSRVRVRALVIQATDSATTRYCLLKRLGTTGTVISCDPRWTLPRRVKFDDGACIAFAEDNLEVLKPRLITSAAVIQRLVVAIARHPAAESDPEVADAVNAIEDALKEAADDT